MNDTVKHVVSKLTSGRWIVTVAAATVFATTAITGSMPSEDVKLIIGIVVTFYFTKHANGD